MNQTPAQRIKQFEKRQYIISAMGLLIFCGLSVVLNTLHVQSVAEETTRFLSRMVKLDDFREASLILQEARLANFKKIHYQSEQPGRSFVLPPKAEVFSDAGFLKSLTTDSITVPVEVSLSSVSSDKITFEFDRFSLIPYAFYLWLILNLVSIPQTQFMKRRLSEQFKKDLEVEKQLVKSEVAQQVRHNLRTPLAALMRIPKKLPDSVSKDRELLELTIGQIRELISKLDDRPEDNLSYQSETNIYSTLIQSKREIELYVPKAIQLQFEVDDMISSALVHHVPVELRALLGNLVTNSIEALGSSSGKILVRATDQGTEIAISVFDTGQGIPAENLSRVFAKDFSFGKKTGSGIGLSHAKEHIEAWGGSIRAESVLEVGTTLTFLLPVSDRATWYVPRLKFDAKSRICVIDDQEAGRELWRLKLDEAKLLTQTRFSSDGSRLRTFEKDFIEEPEIFTFLFDYDLGPGETGLSLLQKMPSRAVRCLVTGHFDNAEIRETCATNGLFLIPKSQISEIPLIVR
ncbi:MAG: HAMP domain-containing sensor histidine kinase [Pseudobdellovibrio sp.]